MKIPFIDLKAQYQTIKNEIDDAINRVVQSQQFILGSEVQELELTLAAYNNAKFAIGVSSGTDALLVSLLALQISPGDEIITTPFSFVGTVSSIARLGAVPVFVDINPATYNIDALKVEKAITKSTKVILPVHLYGQMADTKKISEVAMANNIKVIEDCAQSIGSEYDGHRAGTIGDLGCISFFPTKNLGAYGDAGMIITNNDEYCELIRLIRNQGQNPKYFAKLLGGNFRLDELQAAILLAKSKYLDMWTEKRRTNANNYNKLFSYYKIDGEHDSINGKSGVMTPFEIKGCRHVFHQYVIRVANRDKLKHYLFEHGVDTEIYYPYPLHLQDGYRYLGYRVGSFPESEKAANQVLALPIYPELSFDMQEYIVSVIADFFLRR